MRLELLVLSDGGEHRDTTRLRYFSSRPGRFHTPPQTKNKGTLEHAQTLANHASPRTTKLYDRRSDEISLDEVEKISI
jgi:hypothetical protein